MLSRGLLVVFVFLSVIGYAQKKETLKPSAISKLIPAKVKGYTVKGDSRSSVMNIGSLRYSLSEKVFICRDKTIKILLFDYVEAPIMFNQATKRWSDMQDVKTDSISFLTLRTDYGEVWQSEHPRSKRAQLLASINERFFLTLESENMTIDELKEFFKKFDLTRFPK